MPAPPTKLVIIAGVTIQLDGTDGLEETPVLPSWVPTDGSDAPGSLLRDDFEEDFKTDTAAEMEVGSEQIEVYEIRAVITEEAAVNITFGLVIPVEPNIPVDQVPTDVASVVAGGQTIDCRAKYCTTSYCNEALVAHCDAVNRFAISVDDGGVTLGGGIATSFEVQSYPPLPIDCEGDWAPWSDCSSLCAGGTQARTYAITIPAAHGGQLCLVESPQTQACNLAPCTGTSACTADICLDRADPCAKCEEPISRACAGNVHPELDCDCSSCYQAAQSTCDMHTCSSGALKLDPAAIVGADDATCCNTVSSSSGCTTSPAIVEVGAAVRLTLMYVAPVDYENFHVTVSPLLLCFV